VLHVPYKGAGASLGAAISGESQVTLVPAPSVVGHLSAGRLRALAMGGRKRSPLLPDMPTIQEAGVPGYVSAGWAGFVAPVKTPKAIRDRVYAAVQKTMKDPGTLAAMTKLGAESMATTPEEFAKIIRDDWKSFGDAIRVSGIKPN